MGLLQVLPLLVRVDLGVMAIKKAFHTSLICRTGALQSDAVWCDMQDTPLVGGFYASVGVTVSIF